MYLLSEVYYIPNEDCGIIIFNDFLLLELILLSRDVRALLRIVSKDISPIMAIMTINAACSTDGSSLGITNYRVVTDNFRIYFLELKDNQFIYNNLINNKTADYPIIQAEV